MTGSPRTWRLALAFMTLVLAGSAHAQQSEMQPLHLTGTYGYSGKYVSSSITIEPEGRYYRRWFDCTEEHYEAGTYTFKAGVLSLVTTKRTVKGRGESDDQAKDLLDPKVYKEMYQQEPARDDRKEELVPVNWGERLY